MEKTLYSVLQLSEDATAVSIQSAYERARALYETKAMEGDQQASALLKASREAFLTLSDKAKRASYDFRLRQRRVTPVNAEKSTGNWIVIVVLIAGAIFSYKYYTDYAEKERMEAAAQAERLRLKEEGATEREAELAAEKAAYEEQKRLEKERAWFEKSRREGDEIIRNNQRAEQQAALEKQRQERALESQRAREDAEARRRLEADKRKLRELQHQNRW